MDILNEDFAVKFGEVVDLPATQQIDDGTPDPRSMSTAHPTPLDISGTFLRVFTMYYAERHMALLSESSSSQPGEQQMSGDRIVSSGVWSTMTYSIVNPYAVISGQECDTSRSSLLGIP